MKKKTGRAAWWMGLLAGLLVLNILAAAFHTRFDLTEEKRFSLTSSTKTQLDSLQDDVVIDVFLKGDFPAGFRKLAATTQEFLTVLKAENPGRISYRFISPEDDAGNGKSWGDSLRSAGVEPINLTVQAEEGQENKNVFPYALVRINGGTDVVNLFPTSKRNITNEEISSAEALMEYGFAKSIDKLTARRPKVIAYAVGNGQPTGPEIFDLQRLTATGYVLKPFDLVRLSYIPKDADVLMVVKPTTGFSEAEKLKIDQYIMNGGKVLMFLDNLFAEGDSLSFKSELVAYDRNLNLTDLLFNYGLRINPDLVMDLQCDFLPFGVGGTAQAPQYEFLQWNYYPLFESRGSHPINKNLGLVAGRYVNSIDTVEAQGIRKTVLLQTSANSRLISTPALISTNENRKAQETALYNKSGIPVAVLLEGSFGSLYRNRVSRAQQDSLVQSGGFKEASTADAKLIVVADGDMVLNDVSNKQGPLPMGTNLFTVGTQYEYPFANREFLLNSLEYLTSSSTLISTRNKQVVLRLLDDKKVKAEQTKWQAVNIAVPIALVVLLGVVYQRIRRHRFASA